MKNVLLIFIFAIIEFGIYSYLSCLIKQGYELTNIYLEKQ